jgi:hypothetical protein
MNKTIIITAVAAFALAAGSAQAQTRQDWVRAWNWSHCYATHSMQQLLDYGTGPASPGADIAAAARSYYPGNVQMQQWFYNFCEGVGVQMISGFGAIMQNGGPREEVRRRLRAYIYSVEQQRCGF